MWTWAWLDSSGYGGVSSSEPDDVSSHRDGGGRGGGGGGVGGASGNVEQCLPGLFGGGGADDKSSQWPGAGAAVEASPDRVSVWTATFNCAGRSPADSFLTPEVEGFEAPDICVFGLQELDTSPLSVVLPTGMTSSEAKEAAWRRAIAKCVPAFHREVASSFLVGMLIVVYAAPRLHKSIRRVRCVRHVCLACGSRRARSPQILI
jgi:hypothetical protein